MTSIPHNLKAKLEETLLTCGPFDSNAELKATFVDARINAWRNNLPEATNQQSRVRATIDFLCDKSNTEQENALVLFLRVIGESISPQLACHSNLLEVANELEIFHKTALESEDNITAHDGDFTMEGLFQTFILLIVALSTLLFFGPIMVIISVIGYARIGPIKIDLKGISKGGRAILGILGLIIWLSVYIPLLLLAAPNIFPNSPTSLPETTQDIILPSTVVAISTPLLTPTLEVIVIPTQNAFSFSGTYNGTFTTNGRPDWVGNKYKAVLTLSDNLTGTLDIDGMMQYDGLVIIEPMSENQIKVLFDDIDGDQIEMLLEAQNNRFSGKWRYTGVYTATGTLNVSK